MQHILSLLADADPEVRAAAARTLGTVARRDEIGRLLPLLKDADSKVRKAAFESLWPLGFVDHLGEIAGWLDDADPATRVLAAEVLGNVRAKSTVGRVALLLDDPQPSVRRAATVALGNMTARQCVPQITAQLRSEHSEVRVAAIQALGPWAGDICRNPIAKTMQHDLDPQVRYQATLAVGEFQARSYVDAITKLLADKDLDVRVSAITVLGRWGDGRHREAIADFVLPNGSLESSIAAEAMCKLGLSVDTAALLGHLRDADFEKRAEAALLLGKLRAREHADALVPLLRDEESEVRTEAAWALGEFGLNDYIPPLLPLLDDCDAVVKATAAEVLVKLGAKAHADRIVAALREAVRGDRHCPVGLEGLLDSAVEAIELTRSEEYATAVQGWLHDSHQSVRRAGIEIIGATGTRAHAPFLIPVLRDGDPAVRTLAIEALNRLDASIAHDELRILTADPDKTVRLKAQLCLVRAMGMSKEGRIEQQRLLWVFDDPVGAKHLAEVLETLCALHEPASWRKLTEEVTLTDGMFTVARFDDLCALKSVRVRGGDDLVFSRRLYAGQCASIKVILTTLVRENLDCAYVLEGNRLSFTTYKDAARLWANRIGA